MKNNDVFQVLVVSNTSGLASGNDVGSLAVGQLGVFDAETNKSVDIAAGTPLKAYIAVGLPNADGALGDIRKSAGEYINTKLINTITVQDCIPTEQEVLSLDLTGYTPLKESDYVIRFNFMNEHTMTMQGFNHPAKSFVISTGAVAPTLKELVDAIVAEVNKDEEKAVVAANSADVAVLFTIGKEDKVPTLAGLNPKYHYLRPLKAKLSVDGAFTLDDYTITTANEIVYGEGSGYDIMQEEYLAGGFNGDPGIYRDSNVTGLIGYATLTFADVTKLYWVIRLNYEFTSHSGGGLPYSNQLETVIAVPCTDDFGGLIEDLVDMADAMYGITVADRVTTTSTTVVSTTTTTTP